MNTTHTSNATLANDSISLGLSRRVFSLARIALLALPLAASLGCTATDESDDLGLDEDVVADDDAAAPKRLMPTVQSAALRRLEESPSNGSAVGAADVNSGHGINYHNGAIMSGKVNVYYIFYGSWTGNDWAILMNFMSDYPGSPNYNINTTYDDQYGDQVSNQIVLAGNTTDNYSQGAALTDAKVFTVVKTAIGNGSLPLDANGVYFVLSSPDVTESSGFCSSYCGWHYYGTYSNTTLKYSFVGNPATQCPASCEIQTSNSPNGSPGPDGMVSVVAHELEEATSDPLLNAWYDSSGYENADKCAWSFGSTFTANNGSTANMQLHGKQYMVQQNWLNSGSGSCVKTYGQLSSHGGSGGSIFDTACYAGAVAVGVVGRGGSMVDKIGLICAPINSDGTLSSSTYTTTQYGGSGGSAFTKQCASGQAMVGIEGRSGSKVDQLTIKCSSLSNWESNGTVQSTVFAGGGGGGGAFDDNCMKGHALNRITGRSGSVVDQVQGGCARLWPY